MYRRRYTETERTRLISHADEIGDPVLAASLGANESPVLLQRFGDNIEMLMTTHRTFLKSMAEWKIINHVDVVGVETSPYPPIDKSRAYSEAEVLSYIDTIRTGQLFDTTITIATNHARYTFTTERGSPYYGILRLYRFVVSRNMAVVLE